MLCFFFFQYISCRQQCDLTEWVAFNTHIHATGHYSKNISSESENNTSKNRWK